MRYALLLILPLLLLGCERKAPEAATANSPAENGTILSFPKDDSFLPQDWKVDPISAQITPIAPAEIEKATEILEAGLAKYPSAVLGRFLNKVRVVGSLRFYDVGYGGTFLRYYLVQALINPAKGFQARRCPRLKAQTEPSGLC